MIKDITKTWRLTRLVRSPYSWHFIIPTNIYSSLAKSEASDREAEGGCARQRERRRAEEIDEAGRRELMEDYMICS